MGNNVCCQQIEKNQFLTEVIAPPQSQTSKNNKSSSRNVANTSKVEQYLNRFPLIKNILKNEQTKKFLQGIVNKDEFYYGSQLYQSNNQIFIGKDNQKDIKTGYGILLTEYKQTYFEGQFENGKKNGKGIMIHKDGQYYYGDWIDDLPHGNGVYCTLIPFIQYRGQWSQGTKHGSGIQIHKDGSKYIGNYNFGQKQGFGKFIYPDQTYYQGDFKNNKFQGIGHYKGKNQRYEGSWKNGKFHGAGTTQWLNQNDEVIGKYFGQYKQGIKQGYGQYRDGNGTIYKAMWINGQMNNQGPIDIIKKSN